uniref:Ribosome-recycling factor, chloroplastic n=1 Tax=Panagrolaimus sp. ES5 TaxID=591445 RepID=A0AC34GY61_9BILA
MMFTKFRSTIVNQIRFTHNRKPTGRRTSATTATPSSSKFFKYQQSKTFTKEMLVRFGQNTIDDAILILNPGSKMKMRKLDEKKRKQLSLLYFENIAPIICELPEAADTSLIITKVDTPNHLNEIKVWWRAYGDERDIKIKDVLESNMDIVRKKLSETMYHSNVPPLKFIPDRSQIVVEEMNQLFAAADYGMQYRALSRTGAVLGSQKDSGIQNEAKVEKVPRFVIAMKNRIQEKKRQIAEEREKETQNEPSDIAPQQLPDHRNES